MEEDYIDYEVYNTVTGELHLVTKNREKAEGFLRGLIERGNNPDEWDIRFTEPLEEEWGEDEIEGSE